MPRLFASFPEGRPGVGLLLLRAGVGAIVLAAVVIGVVPELDRGAAAPMLLRGVAGLLLVVGLLTPFASVLLGATTLAAWLAPTPPAGPDAEAALLAVVAAGALALVGPGAYSVDARLFGRREIIVPPAPPRRTV